MKEKKNERQRGRIKIMRARVVKHKKEIKTKQFSSVYARTLQITKIFISVATVFGS